MPQRDIKFYGELVVATVLSLVAANAWIRWISQSLNHFFPGSLKIDFFVAIITTVLAVVILSSVFSDNNGLVENDEKKIKSSYDGETSHPEFSSLYYNPYK